MGIGYRIKEARERMGLTQTELGALIGVTGSAITNYEKETSHPKEQIIYKLMETLNVDANYLFQDAVKIKSQHNDITLAEYDYVKKYRDLDESGKEAVLTILDNEYERCHQLERYILSGGRTIFDCLAITKEERDNMIYKIVSPKDAEDIINLLDKRDKNYNSSPKIQKLNKQELNAAHSISLSSEEQKHDDEIMNSDEF